MLLFGENSPSSFVSLICNGQGPVVTITPNSLDFDRVQLLESHSLNLFMVNDSPIPAEFSSHFVS